MDILHRVAKAAKETGELGHQDHDAMARAAIATLFNWLGDPSESALEKGVIASHGSDLYTCRRVWSAMLSDMRKEAGF